MICLPGRCVALPREKRHGQESRPNFFVTMINGLKANFFDKHHKHHHKS